MTTDRRTTLVGQVLGDRYEVVRRIARGGMATVYVANDLRLSREVAIKVMNEGLGDADEFAQRFDAEARAAAHLSHPHVVSVFDQGSEDGRPWIVMEYVPGFTLRQVITREAPMDPARALALLEPVASALGAAHRAGLIHRDVKPENVLISDRGEVKVADFGLARAVTAHSQVATAGLVIGTVSYIAPELVAQGHADARSDVYSLGIVLYEMLTGRKPHSGESPIQVAYSHVHNQIAPPSMEVSSRWRDGHGGIPPYVDALVTTAANRDRSARPADAGVLLARMRAARSALVRGVVDDPALVAQMRRTEPEPVSDATTRVPTLPPTRLGAERRFTPVTPVSPSFAMSADGAPFYPDGPHPYSPRSPHTRPVPTLPAPGASRPTGSRPAGPRRVRWGRLASVLAAIALVCALVWGGWFLLEGRWTTTPALSARTQADAQAVAAAADLGVRFEPAFSETVPVGQVIRTDPAEGQRALRDQTIVAYVSRGPERFEVPNVVGLTRDAAQAAITGAHLGVGAVKEANHDTVPAGQVISQGTKAGSPAKRDQPVALVVSSGPAPVAVTSFANKPYADLQAWAKTNAITLTAQEQNHDTVPAGSVIAHDPASGELLRGGAMSVVVSKGPVTVPVPSGLRGLGAEEAAKRIRAAGLTPKYEKLVTGGFGLVLSVQPGEGTQVPRGSTVMIRLV